MAKVYLVGESNSALLYKASRSAWVLTEARRDGLLDYWQTQALGCP